MIRYAAGALDPRRAAQRPARQADAEGARRCSALVAAIGMVGFNLAVLGAVEHIGATNTGVIIGASPVILALTATARPPRPAGGVRGRRRRGDRQRRRQPASAPLGALIALAGARRARSASRCSPRRCSRASARSASPPGRRSSPPSSSPSSAAATSPPPTTSEAAAIAYLAVITTALAFVLWFGAVQQLGAAARACSSASMPIAAVTVDAALNGRTPSTADLAGTALVAAGVAFGARPERARARVLVARTRAASAALAAGTSSTCPAASSSPAAAPPARSSRR